VDGVGEGTGVRVRARFLRRLVRMERNESTPRLLPPDDDRRDRDPREPIQPPPVGEPEETPDEPVDDPQDAPGHGEPERRNPQPPEPVRHVASPGAPP
jgi:hypothetical protein